MNFRKKITICPGVKMNVSKSGVSFTVSKGEVLAVVGPSGTGKSVTVLAKLLGYQTGDG